MYFSESPFVLHPFLFLADTRQFYWMLACFAFMTVIFSLIHLMLPSKVERVERVTVPGIAGWMLREYQKTCRPYGNFPSMHVGFSVPVVVANYMVFGVVGGSITLVWALLIALSTLFLKQHYILDMLAGIAAGILVSAVTYWLMIL